MPAKSQKPFRVGDIKVTIDTKAAEKGMANLRKMFDRIGSRLMQLFLEWLQSEDGQKTLRKVIREELKR